MSNGGWEPIQYQIGRMRSFDFRAFMFGFECMVPPRLACGYIQFAC